MERGLKCLPPDAAGDILPPNPPYTTPKTARIVLPPGKHRLSGGIQVFQGVPLTPQALSGNYKEGA